MPHKRSRKMMKRNSQSDSEAAVGFIPTCTVHSRARRGVFQSNYISTPGSNVYQQLLPVKERLNKAFEFVQTWEQSFRRSTSERDLLEQFVEGRNRTGKAPKLTKRSAPLTSEDQLNSRHYSFEEQLQLRLTRTTSIAQTLRCLLCREKEKRLKLFWDVIASRHKCERLFQEDVKMFQAYHTESIRGLESEIAKLRNYKREKDNSRQDLRSSLDEKSNEIIALRSSLAQRDIAYVALQQEIDQRNNELRILEEKSDDLQARVDDLGYELGTTKETCSALTTERDDEVRHRKHLEVLLDIALSKLRVMERRPGRNVPVHSDISAPISCTDLGFDLHHDTSSTSLGVLSGRSSSISSLNNSLGAMSTSSASRDPEEPGAFRYDNGIQWPRRKRAGIQMKRAFRNNMYEHSGSIDDFSTNNSDTAMIFTENEAMTDRCDFERDESKHAKSKTKFGRFKIKRSKQLSTTPSYRDACSRSRQVERQVERAASVDVVCSKKATSYKGKFGSLAREISKKLTRKRKAKTYEYLTLESSRV